MMILIDINLITVNRPSPQTSAPSRVDPNALRQHGSSVSSQFEDDAAWLPTSTTLSSNDTKKPNQNPANLFSSFTTVNNSNNNNTNTNSYNDQSLVIRNTPVTTAHMAAAAPPPLPPPRKINLQEALPQPLVPTPNPSMGQGTGFVPTHTRRPPPIPASVAVVAAGGGGGNSFSSVNNNAVATTTTSNTVQGGYPAAYAPSRAAVNTTMTPSQTMVPYQPTSQAMVLSHAPLLPPIASSFNPHPSTGSFNHYTGQGQSGGGMSLGILKHRAPPPPPTASSLNYNMSNSNYPSSMIGFLPQPSMSTTIMSSHVENPFATRRPAPPIPRGGSNISTAWAQPSK
jgi:hypothetical protein